MTVEKSHKINNVDHYVVSYEIPEEHFDAYEEEFKTFEEARNRYNELKSRKDVQNLHVYEAHVDYEYSEYMNKVLNGTE